MIVNRLYTAEEARDLVMLHHERTKHAYLWTARKLAEKICRERGEVNINDIRAELPPPSEMHASVLGAVFRHKAFQHTGRYTTAKHLSSHARKVGIYKLKEKS